MTRHYLTLVLPMPPSQRSKHLRAAIQAYLPTLKALTRNKRLRRGVRYRCSMLFYAKWYNKDGSIKRRDVLNYAHKLIDLLQEPLGIDDSQIFSWGNVDKLDPNGKEYVVVHIDPI